MVFVFYDYREEKVYIATKSKPIQEIAASDPRLLDYIPNDNIIYIQDARIINKEMMAKWLNGEISFSSTQPSVQSYDAPKTLMQNKNELYIHPSRNGTILLYDIKTPKYPQGIKLVNKDSYLPISEVGMDVLEASAIYRSYISAGKLEIVDEAYVRKHPPRKNSQNAEDAYKKILVPVGISAEAAAEAGGIPEGAEIAVEIEVDG